MFLLKNTNLVEDAEILLPLKNFDFSETDEPYSMKFYKKQDFNVLPRV